MNKISFRKALLKDLNDICQLRHQLANDPEDKLTEEYAPYNAQRDKFFIQRCLRARKRCILVAQDKTGICAHAIILIEEIPPKMHAYYTYHKKALLVHLYVDQNKRRQGIGKSLMKYTLKYLKQQSVEFIDLECYPYNKKAEALYNQIGFKNAFTTKRFKL